MSVPAEAGVFKENLSGKNKATEASRATRGSRWLQVCPITRNNGQHSYGRDPGSRLQRNEHVIVDRVKYVGRYAVRTHTTEIARRGSNAIKFDKKKV